MSKHLLAEAHRYLLQGYPIVAVTGKRPVVPWLAYCGRMPDERELGKMFARPEVTGLALVIGPALWQRHRYLWVLDVEARHRTAAEAWLDAHLPGWQKGRVVESGSGGLHLHLLGSAPARTRPCAFGDIKGERSVAVLPPSLHPKGSYRWWHEGPPTPGEPDAVPPPPARAGVSGGEPAYAVLGSADPIPEGQRHRVLISLGGLLRRAGFSAADLAATLQAVNRRRCQPPLPEAEVRRIAESLARYAPAGSPALRRPKPEPEPGPGNRGGSIDPAAIDRLLAGKPAYLRPPRDRDRDPDRPALVFLTPAQLTEQAPPEVPWLWKNYLVRGAVTVLAGREKAGKSTLLWSLIAALLRGEAFCGQPTAQTPVVALTEETDVALAQKFGRLHLNGASLLAVRPRTGLPIRPRWEDTVAAAAEEAQRLGAGLVVVDTLSWWASLPPEAENDAGAMTAALRPLLELSQRGPAVLAVHHMTKASGELRGSTAIGAMADIILTIGRDRSAPNRRLLTVVGRFSGVSPEPQVVELAEDGQYRPLGDGESEGGDTPPARLLACLPAYGRGMSVSEMQEALNWSERYVRRVLERLLASGAVRQLPRGGRSAVRYLRATADADDPDGSMVPLFQV